jgi:hypothetical protein
MDNHAMKSREIAHVPAAVKAALQETSQRLGGVDFGTVVTAASWAFCLQGEAVRRYMVANFWCKGTSELEAREARRRHNSFKEKIHAVAAYCHAALRRCLAP